MTEEWKQSTISRTFPSFRSLKFINVGGWLKCKQQEDEAEGLWRVYDNIYDLEDFIQKHPGGSFWIKETRGTDITELFEAHHIGKGPELILEKYKIKAADKPRNFNLTFKSDGFYKTLKSRVRQKLKDLDHSATKRSDLIHSALIVTTFVLSILSAMYNSILTAVAAGIFCCWVVISSHNYFHRKDNWRMYAFNIGLMNFNDWRISHAMSHHIYTNSFHDLELSMFEPYFCWIPNPYIKNIVQRYGSWLYGPIVYAALFSFTFLQRVYYSLLWENVFYWDDIIAFTVPLSMVIGTGMDLMGVLKLWFIIITSASFLFSMIGLNAAHHGPEILHDGDAGREDRDWGLYQLDTVIDRSEIKGSHFLILTHFGDHALHHLFPTLDHGILSQLYPILFETMSEFKGELRECNQIDHIISQHKQLARITPNHVRPGSK